MKFSFQLAQKPPQESKRVNVTTGVFESHVRPTEPNNRARLLEISQGVLKVDTESQSQQGSKHLVIPCRNRLDDTKPKSQSSSTRDKKPQDFPLELKYGLNVISKADGTSKRGDTGVKKAVEAHKVEACAPPPPVASEDSTDDSDDTKAAKMLLAEVERDKIRQKLFGIGAQDGAVDADDDLATRASNTVPILMRKSICKRGMDEDATTDADVAPRDYEAVPVEDFGLAMLLGMGFDPKNDNVPRPRVYKRRVYERAGLGADTAMQSNMEALTNGELMSKLKREQRIREAGGYNWASVGLLVKIKDPSHVHYKCKAVIINCDTDQLVLSSIADGCKFTATIGQLETVVSSNCKSCKVVVVVAAASPNIPLGAVVSLEYIKAGMAKVSYNGHEATVMLDSICEYREINQI